MKGTREGERLENAFLCKCSAKIIRSPKKFLIADIVVRLLNYYQWNLSIF